MAANEILRTFVDTHRTEMTLAELQDSVAARALWISKDEVQQTLSLPSLSNLFVLPLLTNRKSLVKLSPQLTLCETCLNKGCKYKTNCKKIHMCRYVSHFSDASAERSCRYPHKISAQQNNAFLLRKYNLETLDEDLLLELLRLHYSANAGPQQNDTESDRSSHSAGGNSRGPRPRSNLLPATTPAQSSLPTTSWSTKATAPTIRLPPSIDNVIERQLDVSLPSEEDAPNVDLEIVQLLLATRKITIERTLDKQISNSCYRRHTMQFVNKQVIDDLLKNEPIIDYNNVPIKLKRTARQKDLKLFTITIHTDQKIDGMRLSLYVETLIDKLNRTIVEMTPDGSKEQIYLIRCDQSIDFVRLHKVHASKNTLQGQRVSISEIYEAETLEVSYVQGSSRVPITIQRLKQLFGASIWRQDVFACLSIQNSDSADIEMMNAEITEKWLERANQIEHDLSLTIRPIIDFVKSSPENADEDEEVTKLLSQSQESSPSSSVAPTESTASDEAQKVEKDPNLYIIKPDWRIVLTHPNFSPEYREYIRQHLHINVQITGSSIQVSDEYMRKELARCTNMFIQTFIFRELVDPSKFDVAIMKNNYTRMAHKWQANTNKTVIVARREVMHELFPQLYTPTQRQSRIGSTPTGYHKQPLTPPTPLVRNQDQISSLTPPLPKPLKHHPQLLSQPGETQKKTLSPSSAIPNLSKMTLEDNQKTLQYPIENAIYLPFFVSPSSFVKRLNAYLTSTFDVQLQVKPISSAKIILELKGRQEDLHSARPALTTLFTSLKTKIYSDESKTCKFVIPDVYRVVQYNLDKRLMTCSCSFTKKNEGSLCVRYFVDNPQFGIDEQQLDDVILNKLVAVSCQAQTTSRKLENELNQCCNDIQQLSYYGQQICCLFDHYSTSTKVQLPVMHLFGEPSIVQQLYAKVNDIIDQFSPELCNVNLTANQINFLLQICSTELIRTEKEFENEGVDLRSKLKSDTTSQFLAPKHLHEKLKLFLLQMAQIEVITKELKYSAQFVNSLKRDLNDLALQSGCILSIKNLPQTSPGAVASSTTQPNGSIPVSQSIGSGSITISSGDITAHQSDVLVVCSTSQGLRDAFKTAAGVQVAQELKGIDITKNMIETSVGQLQQAKKLLFIPWSPALYLETKDTKVLRKSVFDFVEQAIKYTIQNQFKSIAFPAIGCGGYNIPPDMIAALMLDAVREQLTHQSAVPLAITFVIQQQNVFNIFCEKLKPGFTALPTNRSLTQDKVHISLISSSANTDGARKCFIKMEQMLSSLLEN